MPIISVQPKDVSAAVDSVFGRTGVVIATTGDYTAAQVGALAATAAAGGDLAGNYPNPTIGTGKVIAASLGTAAVTTTKISDGNVTLAKLATALPYALVQTGAPTTFTSPLVYDNTAVTGGLYGWTGAAYSKIGGLAS